MVQLYILVWIADNSRKIWEKCLKTTCFTLFTGVSMATVSMSKETWAYLLVLVQTTDNKQIQPLRNEPQHDKTNKMMCAHQRASLIQFSLCAQWLANNPIILQADNEDPDQTVQIPRLIWVFDGCWFCHVQAQIGDQKWPISTFTFTDALSSWVWYLWLVSSTLLGNKFRCSYQLYTCKCTLAFSNCT